MSHSSWMQLDAAEAVVTATADEDEHVPGPSHFNRVEIESKSWDEAFGRLAGDKVTLWGTPAELFAVARAIDRAVAELVVSQGDDPSPDDLADLPWWPDAAEKVDSVVVTGTVGEGGVLENVAADDEIPDLTYPWCVVEDNGVSDRFTTATEAWRAIHDGGYGEGASVLYSPAP